MPSPPNTTLPTAGDSTFETLQKLLLLLNNGIPANLHANLAALANNTVSTLDFGNVTATFAGLGATPIDPSRITVNPTLRTNAGGARVYSTGSALLAATPEYAGQFQIALDGAVSLPRTAAQGHAGDAFSFLADLIYFKEIRPGRVDANSTTVNGVFAGAAHRLQATGAVPQDNVLVLMNDTGLFASITLQKVGEAYPCATFGISGSPGSSEYDGIYISTNSPDGIANPRPVGLYQEQPGRGTHRRIWCDYANKTVTCYGLDLAGAVVNGTLVTDPIGWQVQANGAVKISSVPPANSAATGVAGTLTWDSGFLYGCTSTNTWKRVALATW